MHEFALAQNIIDTIAEKVTPDLEKVTAINLEVGTFAGVVEESLDFGLKTLLADKDNGEVAVNFTKVPTIACCECGYRYEVKEIFEACVQCSSFNRKMVSGMDVMISSVEISED